jgi:sulfatase maturation enzyme AslB (radical SAM superfamily)
MVSSDKHAAISLSEYITIPVWYGCNSRCVFCMLSNLRDTLKTLPFDTYAKLIDRLVAEKKYRRLILSGGEITAFPALFEYIRYAKQQNYFHTIQIQTNGQRLAEEEFVRKLIAAGVNEFFISIHGLEQEHDRLTDNPGAFKKALAGLTALEAHDDITVITNSVITQHNYASLPKLLRLLIKNKRISEHQFWNYVPMNRADSLGLIASIRNIKNLPGEICAIMQETDRALVFKHLPECLIPEPYRHCLHNNFSKTIIETTFWEQNKLNNFQQCFYQKNGQCQSTSCSGLTEAHVQKHGDERALLKPLSATNPEMNTLLTR